MSQGNFFRVSALVGGGGHALQAAAMAPNVWASSDRTGGSMMAAFPASVLSGGAVTTFRPGDQLLVDCADRLEYHVAEPPDWSNSPIGYKAPGFGPIVIWGTGETLWLRPILGANWTAPIIMGPSA